MLVVWVACGLLSVVCSLIVLVLGYRRCVYCGCWYFGLFIVIGYYVYEF